MKITTGLLSFVTIDTIKEKFKSNYIEKYVKISSLTKDYLCLCIDLENPPLLYYLIKKYSKDQFLAKKDLKSRRFIFPKVDITLI